MNKKKSKGRKAKSYAAEGYARKRNDVGNSFDSYLQDVNRIPLLSKDEEVEVAKLASEGNKAAREKLVTSNLRFVIMMAKRYQGKGLPLQDLISEGNMGLLNAAKHFDAEKGYRFITYAVWWVRQAIVKAIHEKGRMIRVPSHKSRALMKGEMKDEMKKELHHIANDVLSLDDPISQSGDSLTLKDFVQDEFENSLEERAANSILQDELEAILSGLEERTAAILRCRFGLGGMGPMTLQEVGERYHLTRERVRQIENRALTQIEATSRDHNLDSFIA